MGEIFRDSQKEIHLITNMMKVGLVSTKRGITLHTISPRSSPQAEYTDLDHIRNQINFSSK